MKKQVEETRAPNKTSHLFKLGRLDRRLSASHASLAAWPPPPPQQVVHAAGRFHRAAVDGHVDMLCDASKRDTNLPTRDQHQLTPTLLAAQCGRLDALRVLVGRGGDPERVSANGSSALHLAAGRNHLSCVSFLANFGANLWALDDDLCTPREVAARNSCNQVLDYLDQVMAKRSAIQTVQVQKLKAKAKVAAEKRIKQVRKAQLRAIKQVERDERLLAKLSNNRRLLKAARSISDIELVGWPLVGGESASSFAAPARTVSFSPQPLLPADQTATATSLAAALFGAAATKSRNSDATSSCPSSVSSTSGYLSSCSAKSILKSAVRRAQQRTSLSAASLSQQPQQHPQLASLAEEQPSQQKRRRPKYSDLVAVTQAEMRQNILLGCRAEVRSGGDGDELRREATPPATSASLASRLRGIGGVSRKVHLRRLLQSAGGASGRPTASGSSCQLAASCDGQSDGANQQKSGADLLRTQSEPDLANLCRREEDERDSSNRLERAEPDASSPSAVCGASSPPPVPPPTPPPPPVLQAAQQRLAASGDQQKVLLTKCLSQLKLQQAKGHAQEDEEGEAAADKLRAKAASGATYAKAKQFNEARQVQSSASDELLRHQLNAGQFPLRPSLIKQQTKLATVSRRDDDSDPPPAKWADAARRKSTTIVSVDSIGSASSLAHRNWFANAATAPSRSAAAGASSLDSYDSAASSSSASASRADTDAAAADTRRAAEETAAETGGHELLASFLNSNGLAELVGVLEGEQIDFEALVLLTEDDLKSLNILLGPRRKLLNAIERYRRRREGDQVVQMAAVAAAGAGNVARHRQLVAMVDTAL